MKTSKHLVRLIATTVAITSSLTLGIAADNILWTWDAADNAGSWGNAWGQAVAVQDSFEDNTGNGGGSLYISTDYSVMAGDPPDNKSVVTVMGNYGDWLWNDQVRNNLADYSSLEFDLKWDTESTISIADFNNSGGDNGLLVWTARFVTEWQWIALDRIDIPEGAATDWVHISIPIDPSTPDLDNSAGLAFKKWVPQETADGGGVAAFWVDNVELVARATPLDPPTMSLSADATPGLNLITLAGSEWQRQSVRTVGDDFSWVGSIGPTTYEFTIQEVPDVSFAQFQTHIFLVPSDPRTRDDIDWGHPDIVFFDMRVLDDGTFGATFRYKIDMPDSNSFVFGDGALGSVASSTALGRWGMTFNDDTSITIFSPEESLEVVLPTAAVANFDDAVTVYFGCQPNAQERIGQKTVLAQAKIQGAVGGVDLVDDFAGPLLDPITWESAARYPNGVMVLTDDALFWLGWSLPDSGFSLQAASEIGGVDWAPFAGSTPTLPTGATKSVLIYESDLPDTAAGYFRMNRPVFSKLQILLPGETAAPGTPTGKTGAPDPQTLYEDFTVTINAVSDDWALISSVTDTVSLTSATDAEPLFQADTALVNGTVTMTANMGTLGTQTITVSNVTDPAIQSDTSSGFTVNAP